ncbi:hypothetical protein RQZ15_08860 [Streptococcus pneumoniae]|nr:hypothetical protein [Streptococcus pneumoniae]MDT5669996.1 hypothetical protein [Streptococcus pneumoniae]MDT6126655.1 hypothetical protein [Streptococcus pneumoniae]
MSREYKTVRIAHETKYMINELILLKEEQLKSEKSSLIDKYESILKEYEDFSQGYSPTLSIMVSSGSILEAAYYFVKEKDDRQEIEWSQVLGEIASQKVDYSQEVGTITPRFYLFSDVLQGLEDYRYKLKPDSMQRVINLNYVIKIFIYLYYTANIKEIELVKSKRINK